MNLFSWLKKSYHSIKRGSKQLDNIALIAADDYIQRHLMNSPKYDDPRRLSRFGFQVHSQNDEDGIMKEIFERIGTVNQTFVEFGVENGLECNTAYLLLKKWSGYWMESSSKSIRQINRIFGNLIKNKRLLVKKAFVTASNIETLFHELGVPKDIDLLSIDIDGNDYWIWKAIENYNPRVVIVEYNAKFRPGHKWVRKYNPFAVWNEDSYYGASLESLVLLGNEKGYKLVGCDFTGTNSFFVREDLVGDKFFSPFTAANHYEPPRYFLMQTVGHKRGFGEFEAI